ncbi:MAG TPA: hypothetical protein VH856_03180 [Steroidobacteraceae bacterium]
MSQRPELLCWRCGAPVPPDRLPLSRTEECRACHAELHVCRMCRFYDITRSRSCAEPVADEVRDKERANFCGYFEQATGRHQPAGAAAEGARSALEALFGPKK